MSQPELIRELRAAKPVAPAELRERVRLVAAQAPVLEPKRRWRRALAIGVPVVAVVAVAAVVWIPRGNQTNTAVEDVPFNPPADARKVVHGAAPAFNAAGNGAFAQVPTPSSTRLQKYTASLSLQVKNNTAISDASKQAVAITRSLGGYPQSVNVSADTGTGYANLTLKIPKPHVTEAVRRFSALGTILSENVSVQDLTSGVNATDRLIASLQNRLALLRAQPQTKHNLILIQQLTTRIQNQQRARAATVRAASYATVNLQLTTKAPVIKHHKPGALHGLGTAFRWIGIGAIYVLALGTPLVLLVALVWFAVRALRRWREEQLLSRT